MKQEPVDTSIYALRALGTANPPKGVEQRITAKALARLSRNARVAAPAGRRWLLPAVAVGFTAAAALIAVQIGLPLRDSGTPSASPSQPIAEAPLPRGAVRTATQAPTSFGIGPHWIEIARGGKLRVELADRDATDLRVEAGLVHFHVHHLEPSQSFKVRTDQVLVEVVGTRFSVESSPGCSTVAVEEGRVQVTDGSGARLAIGAGEQKRFCGDAEAKATEALLREALVLVSSGRDLERAAGLLKAFRQRQHGGALGEEALFHLCLVEARLGRQGEARALAKEFRDRFPASDRAGRLDRWLADRAERQGDSLPDAPGPVSP